MSPSEEHALAGHRERYASALRQAAEGALPREDPRSHDWLALLPLSGKQDALVIGIGEGLLPAMLARSCRSVTAVDRSDELAADLMRRCVEMGLQNLRVETTSDIGRIQGAFDLVVVSDWPGVGISELSTELSRLCNPNGTVCFFVANRFSPASFVRSSDARPGMPVATRRGLVGVMSAAGFERPMLFAPLPRPGQIPLFYMPLDHSGAWRYFLRHLFPLFALASPEVKRKHALEYGAAKLAIKVATIFGIEGLLLAFIPGFLILARNPARNDPGA